MKDRVITTAYDCSKCGMPATGRFSPDMDIKGLCFCDEHKREVQIAYSTLMRGKEKLARQLMKDWKD
jgi:hypothetical protein